MNYKMIADISIPQYGQGGIGGGGWLGLGENPSLGTIISRLLPHLFVIAGILTLLMVLWGGISLMLAAGNPEATKKGQEKVTYGIIGFFVVFISYFVVQIIEQIFKISIF